MKLIKKSDKLVGTIGIHNIDWIHRRGSISLLIGNRDYWGQNLGAEAVEMLNVPLLSPPVPQVSNNFEVLEIDNDLLLITVAIPAISSGVSPFNLRAVTNDPN